MILASPNAHPTARTFFKYRQSSLDSLKPVDIEQVKNIRSNLADIFHREPDAFDSRDIDHVVNDANYVTRFLREKKGDQEKALKMLDDTLRWRHINKVNDIAADEFPQEFFRVGEMHLYIKDRHQTPTIYVRVDRHRPISMWKEQCKRFILYNIEQCERLIRTQSDIDGVGVIFDARNGSLFNVELDLNYFGLMTVVNYYPRLIKYIVIFDIPWYLRAIFNVIKSWLPKHYRDLFVFLDDSMSLDDFIGLDNVPTYMGGRGPILFPRAVNTSPTFDQYAENLKLTDKMVEQAKSAYQFALDEYDRLDHKKILNQ